jgi:hypothetical protein
MRIAVHDPSALYPSAQPRRRVRPSPDRIIARDLIRLQLPPIGEIDAVLNGQQGTAAPAVKRVRVVLRRFMSGDVQTSRTVSDAERAAESARECGRGINRNGTFAHSCRPTPLSRPRFPPQTRRWSGAFGSGGCWFWLLIARRSAVGRWRRHVVGDSCPEVGQHFVEVVDQEQLDAAVHRFHPEAVAPTGRHAK